MTQDIKKMMEEVDKTISKLDEKSLDEINLLDSVDSVFSITEEDEESDSNDFIKCGSETDPNSLAFYIAKEFETKADCVIIQTIGPKALSKAILAIIRLKSIVAPYIDGSTLVARFSVRKLQLANGEERTTIRTRLFPIPDRFSL